MKDGQVSGYALAQAGMALGRAHLLEVAYPVPPRVELRDGLLYWSWQAAQGASHNEAPGWWGPTNEDMKYRGPMPPSRRELAVRDDMMLARHFKALESGSIKTVAANGALDAFRKIETDEDILEFARRWGPLGICKHGLPSSHDALAYRLSASARTCQPLGWSDLEPYEPVDAWYRFVDWAKAILSLTTATRQIGKRADREAWARLEAHDPFVRSWIASAPDDLSSQLSRRLLIARAINTWLELAAARPTLLWAFDDPEMEIETPRPDRGSAFLILAVQLMTAATGSDWAYCKGTDCGGQPFLRRHGAVYCSSCRKTGAPARDKQRKYDEKKRAEKINAARTEVK